MTDSFELAACAIRTASALMIGAGAGMGVDSGLPDFRGAEGFWKAYPPFRGRKFSDISTPRWFDSDPKMAWGFFGHRLNMYRDAMPHDGFQILLNWSRQLPTFVFTSNVDGQFQKAGFADSDMLECHGSIHYLQCSRRCCATIWSATDLEIEVDPETIRTASLLPACPACGRVARPNILMFNDGRWINHRMQQQWTCWQNWLGVIDQSRLVTTELGAGLAVPTVRLVCESQQGTLIRVNPRDSDVLQNGISLPVGALQGLKQIDELLKSAE